MKVFFFPVDMQINDTETATTVCSVINKNRNFIKLKEFVPFVLKVNSHRSFNPHFFFDLVLFELRNANHCFYSFSFLLEENIFGFSRFAPACRYF